MALALRPLRQLGQHPHLDEVCHRAVLSLGDDLQLIEHLGIKGDGHTRLTGRHIGVARCDEV